MNSAIIRRIVPVAAITGAVIYAFHGAVMEPDAIRLVEVRTQLDAARETALANGTLQMDEPNLEARLSACQSRVASVRERSVAALDQRDLFERVTRLAHESSVELEQLRALDWKPRTTAQADSKNHCTASACALSLVARYDDLRVFVGALESELGFAVVTRLRVQPASEGNRVEAELELACFAINGAVSGVTDGAESTATAGGMEEVR